MVARNFKFSPVHPHLLSSTSRNRGNRTRTGFCVRISPAWRATGHGRPRRRPITRHPRRRNPAAPKAPHRRRPARAAVRSPPDCGRQGPGLLAGSAARVGGGEVGQPRAHAAPLQRRSSSASGISDVAGVSGFARRTSGGLRFPPEMEVGGAHTGWCRRGTGRVIGAGRWRRRKREREFVRCERLIDKVGVISGGVRCGGL